MLILSIDSAMNGCSVGLYDNKSGKIDAVSYEMTRGQAEHLMPMIDNIIHNNNLKYSDIDFIVVTKGPGAFTGMRIGLSTAKSLGLALNIPVMGIDTFRAILQTYLQQQPKDSISRYGVLLETKRQDFYFQMFETQNYTACSDPIAAKADEIIGMINMPIIIIGDASERFISVSKKQSDYITHKKTMLPDPVATASYFVDIKEKNEGACLECTPFYIREPDVSTPKRAVRKIGGSKENDSRG